MADRILDIVGNLFKTGKEQLSLKSGLLRNKVPIKPVLGLTGLGVLFMAVRPYLGTGNVSGEEIESTITPIERPPIDLEMDLKRTLYLMKEKEKELRMKEAAKQNS